MNTRIAYPVDEGFDVVGISRSRGYDAIRNGHLKTYMEGRRRMVTHKALEAYVAQQYALEGNREEARRRYRDLAARTGNPDALDALARLADADGRDEEARRWAGQAGAAWRERSRLLPLAYAAHYAEHLLLRGDRREALDLAAADYRRRPHPAAIVHYAYALWRSGEPERALAVVRAGEAKGFLTADMKLAEGLALGALGRAPEAGEAMAQARRLNPRIDSFRQQFVAFGRD